MFTTPYFVLVLTAATVTRLVDDMKAVETEIVQIMGIETKTTQSSSPVLILPNT